MVNVRYVNGDPMIGANVPDTQVCPKGGYWGCTPICPWLTIQYSVDQLAKIGGGILYVADSQYIENVVMDGAQYSQISIVGDLAGTSTSPVEAVFCEQRPLVSAQDPQKPVITIKGGANDMRLENLNLADGAHGLDARGVQTMKLITCCVHDNTTNSEGGAGFLMENCRDVLVRGNHVFKNKALDAQHGLGGGGAVSGGQDIVVEGNFFHDNEAKLAGGGLRLDKAGGRITIDDNIFGDLSLSVAGAAQTGPNKADYGGGMSIDECTGNIRIGMLKRNQYLGNQADKSGGGVAIEVTTCPIGQDSFVKNTAGQDGGGLYLHNGIHVRVRGATFDGNQATSGNGGGIYAAGEGVPSGLPPHGMFTMPGDVLLSSVNCFNNKAPVGQGGGLCAVHNVKADAQNSNFWANEAKDGGGLFFQGGSDPQFRDVDVTDCSIMDNNADEDGGGGCISDANARISNSTFMLNAASDRGGGLLFEATGPQAMLNLSGSKFQNNRASAGGGAYVEDTSFGQIDGNSVVSNTGGFYFLTDDLRVLGFKANRFTTNATKSAGQWDIVCDHDRSNPKITAAALAATNTVNVNDIEIK